MRLLGWIAALIAAQVCFCASWLEVYHRRREELRQRLPNGITVLFGATHDPLDLRSGFFQEANFYYLTGWREPGAILLLLPGEPGEVLFLPPRDPHEEVWTGRRHGSGDEDVRAAAGVETVLPTEAFESELRKYTMRYPKLFALAGRPEAAKLETMSGGREVCDAGNELANLRMQKSAEEQALMQTAVDTTVAAHRAAWSRVGPGLYEYQVKATLISTFLEHGCERAAYAPTVGSGPNSMVLHYSSDSRRMNGGELVVVDAGAECAGYAADVTRTVPVSGHFTLRQREIYDIVLGAQNATIAAVKPGMTAGKLTPNSLYQVAYNYINTHGKDKHGEPLGKYFMHGVSHHIGLEVHDASDNSMPLKEGMVISVEPGIYIPEENIGVRIEDVVLVTKDGCRLMSAALPRDPAEIEKAIAR